MSDRFGVEFYWFINMERPDRDLYDCGRTETPERLREVRRHNQQADYARAVQLRSFRRKLLVKCSACGRRGLRACRDRLGGDFLTPWRHSAEPGRAGGKWRACRGAWLEAEADTP